MNFKLRNTLILVIVAVLVVSGSIYVNFFYFPKILTEMQNQLIDLNRSIVLHGERADYYENISKLIEEKRLSLSKLDKEIDSSFPMSSIFQYLDDIQDLHGSFRFNVRLANQGTEGGYGFTQFQLSGEATTETFLSLIYSIEHGPKIMTIDEMTIRMVENAPSVDDPQPLVILPFEMKVRAKYADVSGLPPIERTLYDVRIPRSKSLFFPLISKNLPANMKGLLEVERAELRAVLPTQAVIADATGDIHVVQEGDEVYLGYVTKIDATNNLVEFTLNKGGIVERFVLTLSFQSK